MIKPMDLRKWIISDIGNEDEDIANLAIDIIIGIVNADNPEDEIEWIKNAISANKANA